MPSLLLWGFRTGLPSDISGYETRAATSVAPPGKHCQVTAYLSPVWCEPAGPHRANNVINNVILTALGLRVVAKPGLNGAYCHGADKLCLGPQSKCAQSSSLC